MVDWTELVHNTIQQQAPVNTAVNLQVPHKAGNFLIYLRDYWLLKKDSTEFITHLAHNKYCHVYGVMRDENNGF
jgi:hypothetical protein